MAVIVHDGLGTVPIGMPESDKVIQTADEVRAIKPELSPADQDRYDRIMLYIIDEQKKGNNSWADTLRLLFGYPQIQRKLVENGFEVVFDNGKRIWSRNEMAHFIVMW